MKCRCVYFGCCDSPVAPLAPVPGWALERGCPSSGSERQFCAPEAKHALATRAAVRQVCLACFTKKGIPQPIFSRSLGRVRGAEQGRSRGCHTAHCTRDTREEPVGLSEPFLFNLRAQSGRQREAGEGEGAACAVTLRSCDHWHWSHPGPGSAHTA